MRSKFYTYAWRRDDGTPYYIGKGTGRRRFNKHHHSVPLPSPENNIILKEFESELDAYKHEMYLISVLGRKDLGTGILENKSDGGEGGSRSPLQQQKARENAIKRNINQGGVNNRNVSHYRLTYKDGTQTEITWLRRYCQETGLVRARLYEVARGERDQYKGIVAVEKLAQPPL